MENRTIRGPFLGTAVRWYSNRSYKKPGVYAEIHGVVSHYRATAQLMDPDSFDLSGQPAFKQNFIDRDWVVGSGIDGGMHGSFGKKIFMDLGLRFTWHNRDNLIGRPDPKFTPGIGLAGWITDAGRPYSIQLIFAFKYALF